MVPNNTVDNLRSNHKGTSTSGAATSTRMQESTSVITTKYFGNEVRGDLNADGKEDIAFLLTEEIRGGTVFFYVV